MANNPVNDFRNAMRDALAGAFRPWVATAGVVNTLETRYRPDGMSDRVDIPIVGASGVKDIEGAPAPTVGAANNATKQTLVLTKWKGSDDLTINDKDRVTVSMSYFMTKIADMGAQLRQYVEQDLLSAIKESADSVYATGLIGAGADYRTQTAGWRDATRRLMEAKAPLNERYAALGSVATAAVKGVENWVSADSRGTAITMMTGRLGMVDGVASYQTPLVAGVDAVATGTPRVNGAASKGSIEVTYDGGGAIAVGEVVSFASHSGTKYMVTVRTATAITLDRGLEEAVADNDHITRYDTDDSVIYHRECVAVAFRMPNGGPDAIEEVIGDPETGIAIRLKEIRQENQIKYQVDCLYGHIKHRSDAAVILRS